MKIKTVTLLILAAVISVACGSKDNPITPSISFSGVSNPLSVAAKGVKQSVSLNSSLSWVASADVSWISVSPTSGTGGSGIQVEVSVAENTGEAREGKVSFTVSGSSVSKVLTIRQERNAEMPEANTPATILSQDFTKGLGAFTVQDKNKGGFSGSIWKYESGDNAKYGAQASASEGSGGANHAAESWLVSPEIDLTNYTDANLYFDHAFAFVKSGEPKNSFAVKVSEDGGVNWTSLPIPKWLAAHSYFELAQSGNVSLTAYKGKKIKFAFVYTSTTESAPTWEILHVTVSYNPQEVLPDDAGDQYMSVPDWMELPQVKNPDNYYIHTAILRFDRVRNYSFFYNPDCHVSDWVAYPLYDQFTKSRTTRYDKVVKTNEAWRKDPFVETTNVSSGGSYKWSTYASGITLSRGHQIPSADRLGGAMVNMQTFYTSNVTPQESKFNGGIWDNLENAVRDWSSSSNSTDTLYVVTGCVADASCEKVSDHDGTMTSIPKAYYKALLRLSKGSYMGAGFYFDHVIHDGAVEKVSSGDFKDYAMSLKELEEKTGLTFFANLPADKAAAIKAENPKNVAFWNLK